MIWDGCGDCKYAWPCGKDEDGDYAYLYCIPRERRCEFHYGNYRDKECGLVQGISVGNLRKLLDGLDDSIVVDVWFHLGLKRLNKNDFFGSGTLAELYDWKDPNDETEEEKKVHQGMIAQRHNVSFFEKIKDVKFKTLPKAKAVLDGEEDKPLTQEEFDSNPDLPEYLNPKYAMTDEEYQKYMDSIMTREEQEELSRRFAEARKNNTDIDFKGLLKGKKENK